MTNQPLFHQDNAAAITQPHHEPTCPICGTDTRYIAWTEALTIHDCPHCSTLTLVSKPDGHETTYIRTDRVARLKRPDQP